MATAKKPTPPESDVLKDADGNPIDPQEGGVTPPDLDAPTTLPGPEPYEAPKDKGKAVTMADVASLQGIGIAPDEPDVQLATVDDPDVFVSAGMASDLEQQGWALDPITGRRVERDKD